MKPLILSICLLSTAAICNAQSNPELKQNAYEQYQNSDKAMNIAYQKLMSVLTEDGKKKLRLSQRAWVAFRDAEADFDSHHFGEGKFGALERLGSMNLRTQERTRKLLEDHKRFKEING
ncbi:lysozyme inhibitor LprI family protein [Oceaniferula spumae]